MRLGIAGKLFLTLVFVSMIAAFAMSIASRVSFTRGFLGYLNDQGTERVEALLPDVVDAYRLHGSWNFLRGNPRAWFDLLRPLPRELSAGSVPGAPPSAALLGLDLRIGLIDADSSFVAGNPDVGEDAVRRAIAIDGSTVGWLTVAPFQQINGAADLRFRNRQALMTWLIAAFAVLLAGTVSFWLSRRQLAGLKQVATSVHRLAAGDYSVRVPVLSNDEIGSLAQDCNHLAQSLERTAETRREFMADVSHELRTPLAVLRAELEALQDGIRSPSAESIGSLSGEVERLGSLVDDIYNLSLSDAGALSYRMKSVDICELVESEVRVFHELLAKRGILVEMERLEPILVYGDPDRLKQLCGNILKNSARYTETGGLLRISCSKRPGEVQLDFHDTGPGVPDELLPKLFDRFFRVDGSRNRESGGAGLGLAICRNIVEAHRGRISAERSPLGGLAIRISLPG
jgi:two-component system, OmpR family, sensor histidine kinase BaeS